MREHRASEKGGPPASPTVSGRRSRSGVDSAFTTSTGAHEAVANPDLYGAEVTAASRAPVDVVKQEAPAGGSAGA